jgi:hypothetical protein
MLVGLYRGKDGRTRFQALGARGKPLIEGQEGLRREAGRQVERVGEVHPSEIPVEGTQHGAPVLDLHLAVAQRLAQGFGDRCAAETIAVTEHPLGLEQNGLRQPQPLRAQDPQSRRHLVGIVAGHDADDDVGVEGDQRLSRAPRATASSMSSWLRRGPA